jgi:hypothetical protein
MCVRARAKRERGKRAHLPQSCESRRSVRLNTVEEECVAGDPAAHSSSSTTHH